MDDFSSEFKRTYDTLRNDIRTAHLGATFKKETAEIRDFYLTQEQRDRMQSMSGPHKAYQFSVWVVKALFFKLTPFRRLLFVVGMLMLVGVNMSNNNLRIETNGIFGGGLLVVLILLELKDKLLAHDELHEGRHIQELLMPDKIQRFKGWSVYLYTRSANEVCGDLVDFLSLEGGQAAVAIADVSGKGLHAALLTAKLQATMRALAFDTLPLASLVGRINTIFHRDSPSRLFASLIYAVISEDDGMLRYVNAGHLPPLLVRSHQVTEMGKGDIAIGLVGKADYTEQRVDLESGDLFVLFSDGVTEAKNEQGDFFGKERLLGQLGTLSGTPEEIGLTIVHAVDHFMGAASPSDDLSLVILRRL